MLASTVVMISRSSEQPTATCFPARALCLRWAATRPRPRIRESRLHPRYQTPATCGNSPDRLVYLVGDTSAAGLMTQYQLPVLNLGVATLDVNLPKDKKAFDVLTDFAMFGALSFETLGVASIFVLRVAASGVESSPAVSLPILPVGADRLRVLASSPWSSPICSATQQSESLIGVGFIIVNACLLRGVCCGNCRCGEQTSVTFTKSRPRMPRLPTQAARSDRFAWSASGLDRARRRFLSSPTRSPTVRRTCSSAGSIPVILAQPSESFNADIRSNTISQTKDQ